jgi:Zn-finger protein
MEGKLYFKAIVRVVKSISTKHEYYGFNTVEVFREPIIEARDTAEVRKIMAERYPQFFPTGKVYSKETKDDAQFFYVLIYPLYNYELQQIEKGEWKCASCGSIHKNAYESPPRINERLFGINTWFCKSEDDYCMKEFLKSKNDGIEIPDDINYIKSDSPNYIYKCTEKTTNKCYIGKTRNAPFFRWWNHLKHSNSPFGIYLKNTKLSDWTFEVLEVLPSNIPDSEIFKIESKYIKEFDSIKNGFNSLISNKTVLEISGTLFD